jgi:FemAB-related protein (PEP-CTERM system-associated)
MPFLNYGGICASAPDIESALLNAARDIVAKEKISYLELRNTQKLSETLPTSEHKISMTIELNENPDVIWNNFKTNHRKEIRRSYKNKMRVISGGIELLNIFFPVLAESWRNLGTPIYQKEYFRTILDTFPDKTRIFIVYHEDIPVAAAFNGYFQDKVEGMWLGILPQYRKLYPNYALYWEMIKHACLNKYKIFHLGRSSADSGGEFFKKKWNAEAQQLYWQYYLGTAKDIPQLNVHNPKYRLAIELWKKIPLGVTTFLGPKIARNIP